MEKITSNLENIEAIFLDLDGTIYMGDNLIDGAIDFLNRIEEKGMKRLLKWKILRWLMNRLNRMRLLSLVISLL